MVPIKVVDKSGGVPLPVIFVANHYSSVDPYLFGLFPYEMAFVTSWPFRIPVYNWVMRMARYINAEDGWESVLQRGQALLQADCSLIVWPEGTRSRDGRLGRFRNGAFRLACDQNRPVVPVCIRGTDKVLPPGKRLLRPHRIEVVLLPPVRPENIGDEARCVYELKHRARAAILAELKACKRGCAKALSQKRGLTEVTTTWQV